MGFLMVWGRLGSAQGILSILLSLFGFSDAIARPVSSIPESVQGAVALLRRSEELPVDTWSARQADETGKMESSERFQLKKDLGCPLGGSSEQAAEVGE